MIVVFALAVTFGVTAVALATGAALFPIGPVTLLSGTTVPLAGGIVRLLFVALYVAAAMASLGAIGLALSTLTEHAIGAIAALAILVVTSEVADNVPQFAAIHPYLPTHWWNAFDALLRVPIDTGTLLRGLLSFGRVPAALRVARLGPAHHRRRDLLRHIAMAPAPWTAAAASSPMPQAAVRPVRVRRDGWACWRPVSQGQRRAATAIRGRRAASEIRKARPAAAGITALTRAAAASPATVVAGGL